MVRSLDGISSLKVIAGENLNLTVTIYFNRSLTSIIWKYPVNENDDRLTIKNTVMLPVNTMGPIFSNLHLHSVKLNDAGKYNVTVSNIDGSSMEFFTVIVVGM